LIRSRYASLMACSVAPGASPSTRSDCLNVSWHGSGSLT
jgi:hypothetical protein